mmetsp:Transcript_11163/g.24795  ORF Transcript_11163/g.24795 Transcript_11163/m.24795 type:complete len:503 (-) Transcript_11163:51-1559(-)
MEREIQNTLQTIHLLEQRLSTTGHHQAPLDEIKGLLPSRGVCLYFFLLGDAYLKLHNLKDAPAVTSYGLKVADRCLEAFESGVSVASNCLEIVDPLRLLCIYSWCSSLIYITNKRKKAKSIADTTFHRASLHTNAICAESVELLQRLRDDMMSYIAQPNQTAEGLDDQSAAVNWGEYVEPESSTSHASSLAKVLRPQGQLQTAVLKKFVVESALDVYNKDAPGAPGGVRREGVSCLKSIRRVVSLPVPVQLDVAPSAPLILKALDKIFRTYVRGAALPGQLAGGNTVEFDGTVLSFRHFILHGPYLGWGGFVQFLIEFGVALPPPACTKMGASFRHEVLRGKETGSSTEATEARAHRAPVGMLEAAVVFVESAKSCTPALVLSRFLKIYADLAQNAEADPWAVVVGWAENPYRAEWDIKSGVNFMQFVDCLGKLAMVAYQSARYTALLPTASDKIEHFLSAQLGLTDPAQWQPRVDAKLQKIKSSIRELAHSSGHRRSTKTS